MYVSYSQTVLVSYNTLWAFTYNNYLKCVTRSRHRLGIGYNYPKRVRFVDSLWVVLRRAQTVLR